MSQVTFAKGNSPKDNPTSFWFWVGHLARNATEKLGLHKDYPLIIRLPQDIYVRDIESGAMDLLRDRMSFEQHDLSTVIVIIDGEVISESAVE